MSEPAPEIRNMYNGSSTILPAIRGKRGSDREFLVPPLEPDVSDKAVIDAVRESQYRVLERDGSQFETVLFNGENADRGVLLAYSTYSSSASGNPGNWWESARLAALYPRTAFAYIASPGNGQSGPLTKDERSYYGKTGRVTHSENGVVEPLPTFRNLAAALQLEDLIVTRLLGSSAGGLFATALGVALPKEDVQYAAFNSHPEMTRVHAASLAGRALLGEMKFAAREARRMTPDMAPVNEERVEAVKSNRPDVFSEQQVREVGKLAMLWTNMHALDHGPEALEPDVIALLEKQPDLRLSFIVETNDRLHTSDLEDNAYEVVNHLSEEAPNSAVQAVLVPGTHVFNTHFVRMYEAIVGRLLMLPSAS